MENWSRDGETASQIGEAVIQISIQSKPLYNIIERFAKISILPLFFAFHLQTQVLF